MPIADADLGAEYMEADGRGGFASGTVGGVRTRRYHALLLTATTPPTGRVALVNGIEAWLEVSAGTFALSSHRYVPDVLHPDGLTRLAAFTAEPWPRWTFRLENGLMIVQELVVARGSGEVVLRWRLAPPGGPARLVVRLLLSGRDYHALHHENPAFDFTPHVGGDTVAWRPYPGLPMVLARAYARYDHEPLWYRDFLYTDERDRGLDHIEDLASPGSFTFDLGGDRDEATLVLAAARDAAAAITGTAEELLGRESTRRRGFASPLYRAADAYVATRSAAGRTIIAGYPWFTDWGRDTFIALRGFVTLPGGLEVARAILVEWASAEDGGMLPNRFPDAGEVPEYNSVDAALWYVVAAHAFLAEAERAGAPTDAGTRATLLGACERIAAGYRAGSRFGIRVADDGLVAAGVPGAQLTWMDAKIGDCVVTPRIGKPVEIQALWINALRLLHESVGGGYEEPLRRALGAFRERFWNPAAGCLHDVVDADHVPERVDSSLRPNQILAVGGLPYGLLEPAPARAVVDTVERHLLTPLGLRSLAPSNPAYRARFRGGVVERDSAYHQGTVWPWLAGPFVEAWLRTRSGDVDHRAEARARFLQPLLNHLSVDGLGHVCEVADGDPPHTPGGCPFQAWSLSEVLRIERLTEAAG